MRRPPSILLALALALALPARAADPAPVAGLELGTLVVGKTAYLDVRVKSRDARSLFFTHRDGIGSVRLRDLPPALQARLGYDPASALPDAPPPSPPPRPARPEARPLVRAAEGASATTAQLDALFLAYAKPLEITHGDSLQPEFIRLGLAPKNQGRRPSCAIYAVVSALEFQIARLTGSVENLSEEYLVWATRSVLGLTDFSQTPLTDPATGEPLEDAGYSLPSVISALQTYGVAVQTDMPNAPGLPAHKVPPPTPEIIARARTRRTVFIAPIPGREPAVLLRHMTQALNAGFPVPAGLRWPNERAIRGGTLKSQPPLPDAFHAVTFIGYECPTGRVEDATFIFKNSYGTRWGQGGYGRAAWSYLEKNLLDAYVLDVRAPASNP